MFPRSLLAPRIYRHILTRQALLAIWGPLARMVLLEPLGLSDPTRGIRLTGYPDLATGISSLNK